jgi:hypothetical protein
VLSTRTGLSPAMARLSRRFRFLHPGHWPGPRSLATTNGVSVDVLSSGYLDVSVRRVCLAVLCIQTAIPSKLGGFPHSEISGSTPVCGSPKLIAACHVLHRLLAPRHPPYALSSLSTLGNWRTPRIRNVGRRRRSPDAASAARSESQVPRQPPLSTTSLRKATVCRIFSCQIPAGALSEPSEAQTSPPCGRNRCDRARLVENTGLEPVTSWLQTRRSPS